MFLQRGLPGSRHTPAVRHTARTAPPDGLSSSPHARGAHRRPVRPSHRRPHRRGVGDCEEALDALVRPVRQKEVYWANGHARDGRKLKARHKRRRAAAVLFVSHRCKAGTHVMAGSHMLRRLQRDGGREEGRVESVFLATAPLAQCFKSRLAAARAVHSFPMQGLQCIPVPSCLGQALASPAHNGREKVGLDANHVGLARQLDLVYAPKLLRPA
jgi:hypothetical protein